MPPFTPVSDPPLRRLAFPALRLLALTVGRSSDGIRLCLDEGLTSGRTLDYIYRNEPAGRWGVGRAIDACFLSQPGWRAIRTRRGNLETMLATAIHDLRRESRTVTVLDVASGPGSYILDVIERVGGTDIQAVCRDLDPRWAAQGAADAARRGLTNVRFEVGDALDRGAILGLRPRSNLAVSSGFYDWIADDAVVRKSMQIVHDALWQGGYFVSTNQIGHAERELVARVLSADDHDPPRTTVRSTDTIEGWLTAIGFDVVETRVDPYGFYSVTLAHKPEEEATA